MPLRCPEPWRRPVLNGRIRHAAVTIVALTAIFCAGDAGAIVSGNASCPGQHATHVRAQDELVLIDSRPLGCTTDDQRLAEGLVARRYDPVGQSHGREWVDIDWREVVAWNDPGVATIFYVHGNQIAPRDAYSRGLYVYRKLVRCAGDDRSIRFIIWSWPATQIKGMLRDYRIKAERTRPVGYQLAWLVNQMPADMPIGFLGYSYGARVESGAAHLLAGGSLGGLRLANPPAADRPTEHVYLAPAFEEGWLSPRRFHGKAMEQIDRLLSTVNPKDPAMKFYPLLGKSIRERAMGFDGPKGLPRSFASRVRLLNVTASVGRSHDLCDYVQAPGLMAMAWRRLTFADGPSGYEQRDAPAPIAVASLTDR